MSLDILWRASAFQVKNFVKNEVHVLLAAHRNKDEATGASCAITALVQLDKLLIW